MTNQSDITVSVWCRSDDKRGMGDKEDAFLGMVSIPISSIQDLQDTWYRLQKRSPRSNVAGSIRIATTRAPTTTYPVYTIPTHAEAYYTGLVEVLAKYDKGVLSDQSRAVLGQVAMVWRLDRGFRSIV